MYPTLRIIIQYVLWILCWALGFFILFVFRTAYFFMLEPLAKKGFTENAWAVTFDKFFILIAGIILLAFIIMSEAYLRRGREQNRLTGRFARLFGGELLILAVLHTIIAVYTGFSDNVAILLGTELLVGMTAVSYSFQTLAPGKGKFSQKMYKIFKQW